MSLSADPRVPADALRSALPACAASADPAPAQTSAVKADVIRKAVTFIAQLAGFWAISEAGFALTARLGIALPGNLLGMVVLFVLMACGVVKLEWVDAAATGLLRHLAFFFIPIAVGLMTMGDLIRSHGIAILAVLLASVAAGILASGGIVQRLARARSPARPAARGEVQ